MTTTPRNEGVSAAEGRRDGRTPERREGAEDARHTPYRSHGTSSRDAGRFVAERTEAERFWSKVDRSAPDGCWTWLGQTNQWGYGHFRRTLGPGLHLTVKAHRFAYELVIGPFQRASRSTTSVATSRASAPSTSSPSPTPRTCAAATPGAAPTGKAAHDHHIVLR